jgi:hypothetical protein
MDTKEVIRASMDMGLFVLNAYVSDLSDAELMQRPGPGCNHLAWQLGHLISSEVSLLDSMFPGKAATLPDGFADRHAKEACGSDDPADFCTKQEYLDLFQQVRAATLEALAAATDTELDGPSPEWIREQFPTVGQILVLIGNHPLMHAGQFAVVRRQLDKPILI